MKVEMLFGGNTRFAILEALTNANDAITAYQIAMTRGLDPAATYRCLTEFLAFKIVELEMKERNQTFRVHKAVSRCTLPNETHNVASRPAT